ncbi:hypothetical protein [Paraglaciecola sp. MB-3u-78]|jgi:hypothetical protein|uniref:hypothetical protein n=1 Tax=Paraglaciecola sp. MB-3u-78 TaxID=2058332 RepID=UPI000C32D741|nr:hypothetical protein [Paraglaciecola sp. MB-3u-78]PKG97713.1 hypothetical protein CXF95_14760 [Paraglaciecola sp. MB-3u-78]
MSPDEEQLKKLFNESAPVTDENKALQQVLRKSSNTTAIKDVGSLFIGWVWVLLLGFGASAYSAKRRFDLHQQQKKHRNNKN